MLERFLQYSCDACGEPDERSEPHESRSERQALLRGLGWYFKRNKAICAQCWWSGRRWEHATLFDVPIPTFNPEDPTS